MKTPICPICRSTPEMKPIITARDYVYGIGDNFDLVLCSTCGLKITSPQPTENEISKYYDGYYRDEIHKQFFREYQVGPEKGYNLAWAKNFKKIKILNQLFAEKNKTTQCKLLDVGCGLGGFLSHVHKVNHSWSLSGIDFDDQAVKEAHQRLGLFGVVQGTLLNSDFPEESFDIITMWHYLEHSFDPLAEITKAYELLKPGGILAIGVPNIESWNAKLFGKKWWTLMLPTHLFHFSPESLNTLIRKAGYKTEKIQMLNFVEDFIPSLYLNFSNKGLAGYLKFCLNKWSYAALTVITALTFPYVLLARFFKRSSSFDLYARKPLQKDSNHYQSIINLRPNYQQ